MTQTTPTPLRDSPSLIERCFPVAKLSAESHKERSSGAAQRLTGVGKWWGRKPLVLVRASILGALLPATDNPRKDIEVFERLLGIDDVSVHERSGLSAARFTASSTDERRRKAGLAEDYDGPTDWASWMMINDHLGTNAFSLTELITQLGVLRFGGQFRVGDVFCGGGSIPFEAARLGCETAASDLNPVAGLLTWSAQALLCASSADRKRIEAAQQWVYAEADRQVTAWGIEHDARGRRADAYLWCNEVLDPETGYHVPLSTTWVISARERVVAELVPDHERRRYDINIVCEATDEQLERAKHGTVVEQHLVPPPTPEHPEPQRTLLSRLRTRHNSGKGVRPWSATDFRPAPDDLFQERLYCIRWNEDVQGEGRPRTVRSYEAVTEADLAREDACWKLLEERLTAWQERGFLPKAAIPTDSQWRNTLPSARGWTHWQHLFTPRQLLLIGLLAQLAEASDAPRELIALTGKNADRGTKLCLWSRVTDTPTNTFTSHVLAPVYNWSARGLKLFRSLHLPVSSLPARPLEVELGDARMAGTPCSLWITDPPYADAIPYEYLSEFFLAWYGKRLTQHFPHLYADPKRALALQGKDAPFHAAMIEVYSNLAHLMPPEGLQIVMFTHRDVRLWADLGMIMWASGLKVSAAWSVATETTEGRRADTGGVQSTVLLVLRKRGQVETLFEDEILALMEQEVKQQLAAMRAFSELGLQWTDADLQLSAYAAALRVITAHDIDGLNPRQELLKTRGKGEISPVHRLIEQTSQVASRELIPKGLSAPLWQVLSGHERFYLKALEAERRHRHHRALYQELSKGLTANHWQDLVNEKRGQAPRLFTATELGGRGLQTGPLAGTLLRHVLNAIRITTQTNEPVSGVEWLRQEVGNFEMQQNNVIYLLEYLGRQNAAHWSEDAAAARVLRGTLMSMGVQ